MPDIGFVLVAGVAALVGAIVQGAVGLGLGLVATPIVVLTYPTVMPGAIIVTAAVLPLFTLTREARHADWSGLRWMFAGRLAGTPIGVWLVAVASLRAMQLMVGALVLLAILVTASSARVTRNILTLSAAGLIAGATGTATSIGGPPIALLYQRESGPRVRATLSVFFTIGAVLSLITLAVGGQLPAGQLVAGLVLLPFVFVGFVLSGPLRRYLDGGRTRAALLAVTAASAVMLIVRSLI